MLKHLLLQICPVVLVVTAATPSSAGGVIEGTVSFAGKAPKRKVLDRSTDRFCAQTKTLSEDIVVTGGKVRDVHVSLDPGPVGAHKPPEKPVVNRQKNCMYRPRVVGVMAGQSLAVTNDDKNFHMVRANIGKQILFNRAQPAGADAIPANAEKAGSVMSFHCDVHPWMRAYAVVTAHPFFDVTKDDGAFEVADVPPGRYTLRAWHPKLGTKTKRIVVTEGKVTTVSFELR